MWLNTTWFVLYVVVIAGYAILDGFDLGVGVLSKVVAKNDREQRLVLNSIGPVWDGNEVWLVLAGGVLFAAFPVVYASMFSGFYLAMWLVLFVLIMRTVAIEFRSKRESPRWRAMWDWMFFASSLGITLLLGVALGNVVRGVPIDANGDMELNFWSLLNPYSLALGVVSVVMFTLHGAIFLTLKIEDELLERTKRTIPRLMTTFFVMMTLLIGWTLLLDQPIPQNYLARPWLLLFPALALGAALFAWREIVAERFLQAFLASSAMIALLMASVAGALYPVLIPSSIDPAYDLTIYNAASAEPTLRVMLVITIIGMPFVLLYTAGIYFFFRGKVRLEADSY
jgi:cytochrome d ubiquinol oxidase subunit II